MSAVLLNKAVFSAMAGNIPQFKHSIAAMSAAGFPFDSTALWKASLNAPRRTEIIEVLIKYEKPTADIVIMAAKAGAWELVNRLAGLVVGADDSKAAKRLGDQLWKIDRANTTLWLASWLNSRNSQPRSS